jgi:hypothetical protein
VNIIAITYWMLALVLFSLQMRTTTFFSIPLLTSTPWRNGSASDSRSEGCVFKSRRGQISFLRKKLNELNNKNDVKTMEILSANDLVAQR